MSGYTFREDLEALVTEARSGAIPPPPGMGSSALNYLWPEFDEDGGFLFAWLFIRPDQLLVYRAGAWHVIPHTPVDQIGRALADALDDLPNLEGAQGCGILVETIGEAQRRERVMKRDRAMLH